MFWPFSAVRQLKSLGILGMNRRNAACILDHNPRRLYPLVDDKIRMRDLCASLRVPTPAIYAEIKAHSSLRQLPQLVQGLDDFVIKPACGSAGRGILVVVGRKESAFLRHNGETIGLVQIRRHVSDILSGMYSLGSRPDRALIQQRVHLHPTFEAVAYKGIPDVRIIVYRNEPAMAMLRLPTKVSNGRANLHQGGIGAGVDLYTGITHHAVQRDRPIQEHPDTGMPVLGVRVPYWDEILDMSRRVAEATGLGYLGVDIVVDADHGPMLLEANARPGLAIQIANAQGLLPRLQEIDELIKHPQLRASVAHRDIAGKVWERRRRSA